MNRVEVHWNENLHERVNTKEDLVRVLNVIITKAMNEYPLIARFVEPTGDYLLLGISDIGCFVSHEKGAGEPPYLVSVGDRDAKGTVKFDYEGEATEIPRSYLIPLATAKNTLLEFFASGTLSKAVEWDEV